MDKQGKLGTLVIGIIAVVFLHVGFFIYVANDSSTQVALERERDGSGINLVTTPANNLPPYVPTAAPAPDNTLLAETMSEPADETVETTAAPRQPVAGARVIAVKTDRRAAVDVYKPKRPNVYSIARAPFQPVTITYPANRPFAQGQQAVLSGKVKSAKKRSFIARVMPVIKKPYDWLKAVGSKLK